MIYFKYHRIGDEWRELSVLNVKLALIVADYAFMMGEAVITHLFRTDAQQAKFYPETPEKKSVHQFWRGADLRVNGYDITKIEETITYINSRYIYGKPGVKTAVLHNIGHGNHVHIQTNKTYPADFVEGASIA